MIVIQFVTSYSLKCDSNKTEEKKKTANKQTSVLIWSTNKELSALILFSYEAWFGMYVWYVNDLI